MRRTLAHRPDVAIVDVQMPPRREDDGLVAAIELRRRLPQIGVLVLSQFCEPSFAIDLIGDRPEGVGYLLKERVRDVTTFVDAITRVAGRRQRARPRSGRPDARTRHAEEPLNALTPRERAVLAAMAEGKSNIGIADDAVRHRNGRREAHNVDLPQARDRPREHRAPPRPRGPDLHARTPTAAAAKQVTLDTRFELAVRRVRCDACSRARRSPGRRSGP